MLISIWSIEHLTNKCEHVDDSGAASINTQVQTQALDSVADLRHSPKRKHALVIYAKNYQCNVPKINDLSKRQRGLKQKSSIGSRKSVVWHGRLQPERILWLKETSELEYDVLKCPCFQWDHHWDVMMIFCSSLQVSERTSNMNDATCTSRGKLSQMTNDGTHFKLQT